MTTKAAYMRSPPKLFGEAIRLPEASDFSCALPWFYSGCFRMKTKLRRSFRT